MIKDALCPVHVLKYLVSFYKEGNSLMNQQKIGTFIKMLRKQKGLTQEQIAEKFNVSSRTVLVGKMEIICPI